MDTKFDAHDLAAFVREQVRQYEVNLKDTRYKTTDDARVALIATIGELWPMTTKKRDLRLSILSALLGKSIETQNELYWHETKILLEALHDQDFRGSCTGELQAFVEGEYFSKPWDFPATRIM